MQNGTDSLGDSLAISYKTKHTLSQNSLAIMLLGIYSQEKKTYVCTKTCTCMFIEALFITANTSKQPRSPLVGEWINYGSFRPWNIIQQ